MTGMAAARTPKKRAGGMTLAGFSHRRANETCGPIGDAP
jgi:hypothetical protein